MWNRGLNCPKIHPKISSSSSFSSSLSYFLPEFLSTKASQQKHQKQQQRRWKHSNFVSQKSRCSNFNNNKFVSTSENERKTIQISDLDETVSTNLLQEKLLKAPFQRVNAPPLFPWRHSQEILPRLDPSSTEFKERGHLLGSNNIYTSHPWIDELATAWFFLQVPTTEILFFQHWKKDMAETMSWAFCQGVKGILSNVYQVPTMGEASGEDEHLRFDYSSTTESSTDSIRSDKDDRRIWKDSATESMMEERLRNLYEAAHEYGKHQLQVKLDCRPLSSQITNLFVFPFLSRETSKAVPGLKEQYRQLLEVMSISPRDAIPLWYELVDGIVRSQVDAESTVICQVLMECDEIFWVKDLSTGTILQGQNQISPNKVYHLVRFEMNVKTIPRQHPIIPFEMIPGTWQITDIDDHLDGNVII